MVETMLPGSRILISNRDIKEASFDEHSRVCDQIKALRPEEKFAFSKPLIVHEDVEKICSILMILLKMDVFGWKPFKDKFLSDDWQKRLIELDPDQCKHKQVCITSVLITFARYNFQFPFDRCSSSTRS